MSPAWETVLDAASAVLLLTGSVLSLAAAIGLVRFPDVFTRIHAATKPQVLGLLLVLTGLELRLRSGFALSTLILVALFQFLTAPVSAHMVGRAAYRRNPVREDLLVTDELADREG